MTSATHPSQPAYRQEVEYISDKNRMVALLLALLVGVFGVHRFYVGKTGTGLLMVLLDLTLIGFAVTGIWSIIDAVFIALGEFTDANGDKLVEWDLPKSCEAAANLFDHAHFQTRSSVKLP
jgi:TM2 domain-containing membrane protein YozV